MKVGFKKKHLYINLILGLIWFIFFIVKILENDAPSWFDYIWLVLASLYLGQFFYHLKYKYVAIENGFIKVNGPFGKKMAVTEIKQIKAFAGSYILKSDHKELTINTEVVDPKALPELTAALERLKVEWI